jgi:predicted Zn finger-like uncharacterized protein
MSTVRLRRLKADSARLQEYVRRHPRVRLVQMDGDPPERYQLEYRINSLRLVGGELQPVQSHLVEVVLPRNYPRTPPQCRMLSPVFHPNIAPHAICVGDHWGAGESLESIIIRIGEMLAYQSYNVKSPLNGEAARWVEENKHRVPLDRVSLLPEEDATPPASAATTAGSNQQNGSAQPDPATAPITASASTKVTFDTVAPAQSAATDSKTPVKCPQCATSYVVAASVIGRNVRCKKCGQVFACEAEIAT